MSTYADAAASSGPIGAEKLPSPPQVKNTTNPNGSVEVVDGKEFEKAKKDAKKAYNEAKGVGNEKVRDFTGELEDIENEANSYYSKFVSFVKKATDKTYNYFSNSVGEGCASTSSCVAKTKEEFKNPVVVAQSLIALSGVIGSYLLYVERHRIDTSNKLVVGIHASIITGLVLVDGFLFNKYYPKYDKKSA